MINKTYIKTDLKAALVVFLVALPLCLGIALASGAPLFAGVISGVIGGIVVGFFSNSQLSVSGPAAGLTAIVLTAIATLGSFETFLLAGLIAGVMQLLFGYLKAGIISNYLPSNVIEGMLAAIGIIIILSQIPHAFGHDVINEGDFFHINKAGSHDIFSTLIDGVNFTHPGALLIALASFTILISFNTVPTLKKIKAVPSSLIAILVGIGINQLFIATGSPLALNHSNLVSLPIPESLADFWSQFSLPDFSQITNKSVWVVAITIAAVASIETLLSVEAADKLDPLRRYSNTNTELKAQGIGNILSSLIGGIPMTSVIVRTSANVSSGGLTKLSAIMHGVFLLLAVLLIPTVLNMIPLASLAAILITIGYNLASPRLFKHMWQNNRKFQFIPFIATVVAVVFTDLLMGVGIGITISVFFILRGNLKLAYFFREESHIKGKKIQIELAQEVSFLNKAAIKQTFIHLPENCKIVIDATNTVYIDFDVLQLIKEFVNIGSKDKNIEVSLIGFREEYKIENSENHVTTIISDNQKPIAPKDIKDGFKAPSNILKVQEMHL